MKFPKLLNNISGLQLYQIMRFSTFLFISIIFTKIGLSKHDIGLFEVFMFIAGIVSFFWVSGLVQSFLPLYHSNHTYQVTGEHDGEKSPEIFNAFLLLSFFSFVAFVFGLIIKHNFSVFHIHGNVPFFNLLLLYVLISNPTILVEYIYLLKNKPALIVRYGLITYLIQLAIVTLPVVFGKPIIWAIYGMLATAVMRFVWLVILLLRYAEFRVSATFMREHLRLGMPLIVSTLLSGSAQYLDGVIVTSKFDADTFAIFRYGAKELPLTLMMAAGLSHAMLPEFGKKERFRENLRKLRHKSMRLMNALFPLSIVIMLFSRWLYIHIFTPAFIRSADVFMIYLLLIIPRLVFPQTILIGEKKTRIVLRASAIGIVINVVLSLYLLQFYNVVGIALATVIVFIFEKILLVIYLYFKEGVAPQEYIPVKHLLIYSALIVIEFVLIDHRIIDLV